MTKGTEKERGQARLPDCTLLQLTQTLMLILKIKQRIESTEVTCSPEGGLAPDLSSRLNSEQRAGIARQHRAAHQRNRRPPIFQKLIVKRLPGLLAAA